MLTVDDSGKRIYVLFVPFFATFLLVWIIYQRNKQKKPPLNCNCEVLRPDFRYGVQEAVLLFLRMCKIASTMMDMSIL